MQQIQLKLVPGKKMPGPPAGGTGQKELYDEMLTPAECFLQP
jgi:hypothetical protein